MTIQRNLTDVLTIENIRKYSMTNLLNIISPTRDVFENKNLADRIQDVILRYYPDGNVEEISGPDSHFSVLRLKLADHIWKIKKEFLFETYLSCLYGFDEEYLEKISDSIGHLPLEDIGFLSESTFVSDNNREALREYISALPDIKDYGLYSEHHAYITMMLSKV